MISDNTYLLTYLLDIYTGLKVWRYLLPWPARNHIDTFFQKNTIPACAVKMRVVMNFHFISIIMCKIHMVRTLLSAIVLSRGSDFHLKMHQKRVFGRVAPGHCWISQRCATPPNWICGRDSRGQWSHTKRRKEKGMKWEGKEN